jgi:hypothetical protein
MWGLESRASVRTFVPKLRVVEIDLNRICNIASYFRHYASVSCTLTVHGHNQAELGVDGNAR